MLPKLEPMFDQSLYNGKLTIIHHLDDAVPLKPVNKKKVVFVGRSVREKGIIDAARAMSLLDCEGYECRIYTRKEGLTLESVEKAYETIEGTGVQVHTMNPHAEIMEVLSDTNVLLWTTKKDTVGLVGYEGGSHGCRVIYSIDPPDEHMLPSGCAFKKSWRTPSQLAEAVREVVEQDFDREASSTYFRDMYTPEKDLQRLLNAL
jgi:glycosyltransferase involved in cell wall biosynthesis